MLAVLLACVVACTRPAAATPGATGELFVGSGRDHAVHPLRVSDGRSAGPPFAVEGVPLQVIPAPGGLVVLALTENRGCRLTYLTRAGAKWTTRPLAMVPVLEGSCLHTLLAGDGHHYLAVGLPDGGGPAGTTTCRLVAIDLMRPAAESVRAYPLCGAGVSLVGLAAEEGQTGPVAYAGLWKGASSARGAGSGEVIALDLSTGAIVGRTDLAGAPERLVPAAAPGRVGRRLYVVEGTPGPDERNPGVVGSPATRWRLLWLDLLTFTEGGALPLDASGDDSPPAVAVTPDGDDVIVLLRATARRSVLVAVGAAGGAARLRVLLPGEGLSGLVATDERVYVPNTLGSDMWAVTRRTGRLIETIRTGQRPLGITISPPT